MKKSQNIIFWVLRIAGIVLLIAGIVKLVVAVSVDVPSMGNDGWFEAESNRSFGMFSGIAMIMVGFFILMSSFIPTFKNVGKKMAQSVANASEQVITQKNEQVAIKKCAYCGSELVQGQVKCSSCGASRSVKK